MENQKLPENANNWLSEYLGIIIAVFAVFFTLVFFVLWQRRKSSGRTILITGLSDSGKTLLFTRLLHSKFNETYTSIKENVDDMQFKNGSLRIVDVPGHERLRYQIFDKYKFSTRALVFVIDSATIQKDTRDAAEFLYTLLSDSKMQSNTPVLILCNKQDQATAKGCSVIKTLLEKEINLVRVTKSSQLEATDDSTTSTFLGKSGKDFEFSDLNAIVEFAESHAVNQDPENADIKQLENWLEKIA